MRIASGNHAGQDQPYQRKTAHDADTNPFGAGSFLCKSCRAFCIVGCREVGLPTRARTIAYEVEK